MLVSGSRVQTSSKVPFRLWGIELLIIMYVCMWGVQESNKTPPLQGTPHPSLWYCGIRCSSNPFGAPGITTKTATTKFGVCCCEPTVYEQREPRQYRYRALLLAPVCRATPALYVTRTPMCTRYYCTVFANHAMNGWCWKSPLLIVNFSLWILKRVVVIRHAYVLFRGEVLAFNHLRVVSGKTHSRACRRQ